MNDPITEAIEQLHKLKQYDHYKESNEVHTGSAGMRISSLKDRLASNTIGADAQKHLDQLGRNELPDVTEEQIQHMVDRFLDQILDKVFK